MHGGSLSQRSKEVLGEEFFLEPEQIIGWASSQQTKQRQAADRALARLGKQNYDNWATKKLEKELRKRGIKWGQKRDPGKRRLLEEYDDQEEPAQKKRRRGGGGADRKKTPKQRKEPSAMRKTSTAA